MTTPRSTDSPEVQVAKLKLEQAKTIGRAIKLASLFLVLGVIYTAALVSHQDSTTVHWLGGCLVVIGLAGVFLPL